MSSTGTHQSSDSPLGGGADNKASRAPEGSDWALFENDTTMLLACITLKSLPTPLRPDKATPGARRATPDLALCSVEACRCHSASTSSLSAMLECLALLCAASTVTAWCSAVDSSCRPARASVLAWGGLSPTLGSWHAPRAGSRTAMMRTRREKSWDVHSTMSNAVAASQSPRAEEALSAPSRQALAARTHSTVMASSSTVRVPSLSPCAKPRTASIVYALVAGTSCTRASPRSVSWTRIGMA